MAISFNEALNNDFDGVDRVEVTTICTVTPTPEPSSLALCGLGILAAGAYLRFLRGSTEKPRLRT
jgi:hypothetical protein